MTYNRIILKTKFKDNENCAVCLTSMQEKTIAILPCKHHFHSSCFHEMVKTNIYTCPLCRYDLKPALRLLGIRVEADIMNFYYNDPDNWSYLLYSMLLDDTYYYSEMQAYLHYTVALDATLTPTLAAAYAALTTVPYDAIVPYYDATVPYDDHDDDDAAVPEPQPELQPEPQPEPVNIAIVVYYLV